MRDALRAADFTTVSILDDPKLRAEFRQFQRYCDLVSSPNVDAADIFTAVNEAVTYAHHVGDCLNAHISGQPLPSPPVVSYLSQHVDPLPALPPLPSSRKRRGLPRALRGRHLSGLRRMADPGDRDPHRLPIVIDRIPDAASVGHL